MLRITLGDLEAGTGTPLGVLVRGTNWRAAPEHRANYVERSGLHGAVGGRDLLGVRRLPFTIQIRAASKAEALALERRVAAAFATTDVDVPLTVEDDLGTWIMWGRPAPAEPDLTHVNAGIIDVACRFACTDPLTYSSVEHQARTAFPTGGGGLEFPPGGLPIEFPPGVEFDDAGVSGSLVVENAGTLEVPWRMEITGPWSDPIIERVGTTERLRLAVTVPAGERLLIDSADRSVWLGTSYRGGVVLPGSVWPRLPKGTSELRVRGGAGAGTATLLWRDGWL